MSSTNDSQQYMNEYIKREDDYLSADEDSDHRQSSSNYMLREQDRFLPICNIIKIMKIPVPENGKIAKDARECIQECVSEFISFITSEAIERSMSENRKTVNGDDLLYAFSNLGFDNYVEPLSLYLHKYREATKCDRNLLSEGSMLQDDSSSDIRYSGASSTQNSSNYNSNNNTPTTTTTISTALNDSNNKNVSNEFIEFNNAKDEPCNKPPLRTYANKNNNSSNQANIITVTTSHTPAIISATASTTTGLTSPSFVDQHESLRTFRKTGNGTFCPTSDINIEEQQHQQQHSNHQILNAAVVTTQANDLTAGILNTDHMIIFNTEELMQQVSQQQQQLQQHHQQQLQQQQQQQQQQALNNEQQPQQATAQIFHAQHWP
ncbi:hypothetical protein DOY81_000971, partial [Sarcophaga bullata]